jgi:hypothetical protein
MRSCHHNWWDVDRLRGVEIQSQLLASYPKEDEDGDVTQ